MRQRNPHFPFNRLDEAWNTLNNARSKQGTLVSAIYNFLCQIKNFGAGEGIRTLDPNLGKVVLYP